MNDAVSELAEDLRCCVSCERCRDLYPRVCEIGEVNRAALGAEWRCSTCAVYAAIKAGGAPGAKAEQAEALRLYR